MNFFASLSTDLQAKRLFDEAALDVEKQLVKVSKSGLTYFAEYKYGRLEHKMDHLACFAGEYIIKHVGTRMVDQSTPARQPCIHLGLFD